LLTQCRVVIPFDGDGKDELTLEEGDIITIVSKDLPSMKGWWKGVLRGRTGIFPGTFVQELKANVDSEVSKNLFFFKKKPYQSTYNDIFCMIIIV